MPALPRTPKRIGVAADHGGYDLKEQLARMLREAGYEVIDFGDGQPTPDDDYPDWGIPLTQPIATHSSPSESTGRFICTQTEPWTPEKGRAAHPDAREVGEQALGWPGGDIVTYQCPRCRTRFSVELPQ